MNSVPPVGHTHFHTYAAVDAARDYMRVGMARVLSPVNQCLFEGPKGLEMEDVAAHLFDCDILGQIAESLLAPHKEGEFGILLDAAVRFDDMRRHLRRFLLVRRARDMKKVLFRYYDPRVLRVFLPVCTEAELLDFFGPVTAFHCQGDEPGEVLTFTLRERKLHIAKTEWQPFLSEHFPARLKVLQELGIAQEADRQRNRTSNFGAAMANKVAQANATPAVSVPVTPYTPPAPDDSSPPDFG